MQNQLTKFMLHSKMLKKIPVKFPNQHPEMQVSALKLGTHVRLGMLFIAQRMHVCIAALSRNGNKFAPVFVSMYLVTLMILQPVCVGTHKFTDSLQLVATMWNKIGALTHLI